MLPFRRVMVAVLGLAAAFPTLACDLATVETSLARAQAAWESLDAAALRGGYDDARAAVDCLRTPITVDLAGRLHLVGGLVAFLPPRDLELTERRLSAWWATTHDQGRLESLAPEANPLRPVIDAAVARPAAAPELLTLDAPARAWVDGTPTTAVSQDRPSVVQLGVGEAVAWSGYVRAGEVPSAAFEALRPMLPSEPAKGRKPRPIAVGALALGGASLIAGGVLTAAGFAKQGSYFDLAEDAADHAELRRSANGLALVGQGLMGAGAVLGGVGVVLVVVR